MIASVSGIRGVLNADVSLVDFARFASNFSGLAGSEEVLIARDTRSTGPAIARAVVSSLMSRGVNVVDYGVVSTPALFRESRVRRRPGIMITASHNEPEFNGLKFVVDGTGAGGEMVEASLKEEKVARRSFGGGALTKRPKASYNDDLVKRFGEGSCKGVNVALDLGGGSAIFHAVPILQRLGCDVFSINDSPGIFNRKVDPMSDELLSLRGLVKAKKCDVGLGFDCDGDRLCVVDSKGVKRSGDFMLTLAISRLLAESSERKVVVSQDTTAAIDEVVAKSGGEVFRSKVGEANVVDMMREKGTNIGGEGSSGGLIDGAFNNCRDSMLAALLIMGGLKEDGAKLYSSVKSYCQERAAVRIPRSKALNAVTALARANNGADTKDGVKIWLSRKSWVLVRPSNTEDVVRVSAEAETQSGAKKVVEDYSRRIRELSR
jgi:phosphomannomutase